MRLAGYDYSTAGAYFVTICAHRRALLFEEPPLRAILESVWTELPSRFPSVATDAFVIMPNHVHFIVFLRDAGKHVVAPLAGAGPKTGKKAPKPDLPTQAGASPATTLSAVVGAYKSIISNRWLKWVKANDPLRRSRIWQPNYYDRIIRSEAELNRIREYVALNPLKWALDHENPERVPDTAYEVDWGWLERGSAMPGMAHASLS